MLQSQNAQNGGGEALVEPVDELDSGELSQAMELEIDSELQAAIEYKIATSGIRGAAMVLEILNVAVRRLIT
ncbi:MAG: hypothetical protein AAGB11_08025 [Pseudomonadota bacterium]